jgi:hypothetical protein
MVGMDVLGMRMTLMVDQAKITTLNMARKNLP